MAKFSGKNIEFKDGQKAVFGTEDDSSIYWDGINDELVITTVASGVDPTKDGHLVTRRYLDSELATVSGGIIQDHSNLSGLGDDDHTQYLLADGSRGLSGDWNAGNYSITAKEFYGDGSTLSGIAYVDGDDVYFYDTTRSKDLGVAVIEVAGARDSVATTNQYLRTFDGLPFNLCGSALPWNATLIGIVMSGEETNQTWTIHIRKNNSTTSLASLTITNAYVNYAWNYNVDFSAGDRIQLYLSGNSIDYPQTKAYFRRRK
jgi:hypothetical protein